MHEALGLFSLLQFSIEVHNGTLVLAHERTVSRMGYDIETNSVFCNEF